MQRRNTQSIGEVLRDFFEDNTEIYEKIMNIRIKTRMDRYLGAGNKSIYHESIC